MTRRMVPALFRLALGASLVALLSGCTGPGATPSASIPPAVSTLPAQTPGSAAAGDVPGAGQHQAQPPPEIGPELFGNPFGHYTGSNQSAYYGYN